MIHDTEEEGSSSTVLVEMVFTFCFLAHPLPMVSHDVVGWRIEAQQALETLELKRTWSDGGHDGQTLVSS